MSDVGVVGENVARKQTNVGAAKTLAGAAKVRGAGGAGGSTTARVGGGVSAIAVLALGSLTLTHRRHGDTQAGRVDGPQHSEDVAGACACAEF